MTDPPDSTAGEPDYRRMLESVNAIVWHADPRTFQTTYTTGVAVQLLGYPIEAWTQEPGFWLSHVHPDDRARVVQISRRAVSEGRSHEFEYRMIASDGRIVWLRNIVNVVSRDGLPVGLVGVTMDITEQKSAEHEAAQLRQELARLNRVTALGELSSYLAHELNQPLGAIVSNAEAGLILLGQRPVAIEPLAAILLDIHRDAERGGAVINRLHALLTKQVAERRALRPADMVGEVLAFLNPLLAAHRVRVDTDVPDTLPAVLGDRIQLEQVLLNLVVNAVEALKPVRDRERTVRIGARLRDRGVELIISDNGTGIPQDLVSKLFQPFSTTKSGGMGIGLAISRRIVDAHGGAISAVNNAEHGATFRFHLPLAAAAAGGV